MINFYISLNFNVKYYRAKIFINFVIHILFIILLKCFKNLQKTFLSFLKIFTKYLIKKMKTKCLQFLQVNSTNEQKEILHFCSILGKIKK